MAFSSPTCIDDLPPELISHIFSFLDGPAPSDTRLHDQPSPSMLSSPDSQFLKSVSRVSRQWRTIVLPILFRHVFWAFDRWDLVASSGRADSTGAPAHLPLTSFVREHNLGRHVESLTLLVSDRTRDRDHLPRASGSSATEAGLSRNEESIDFTSLSIADARERAGGILGRSQHAASIEDSNWLWESLFDTMNPSRFTIIALPSMLASLLSRMLFLGDAWNFQGQHHILSLDRGKPHETSCGRKGPQTPGDNTEPATAPREGSPSALAERSKRRCPNTLEHIRTRLFTIRPWAALLLNEGSSTRVYKAYEFFHKRPPSILGSLLGCEEAPNDEPLIPPTVRSFSYVAIFPLSSHFNSLVSHLPPLDRLFIQLVPRNDILDDREEMRRIQVGDLWMERNTCYSLVMRELFEGSPDLDLDDEDAQASRGNGWRDLSVFESGDAADREAWDMAVEYVRMSGTPWTVEGDGVLVRHPKSGRQGQCKDDGEGMSDEAYSGMSSYDDATGDVVPSDPSSEGFELFKVQLMRFAFNGTEHLPYSPARQYAADDELFQ